KTLALRGSLDVDKLAFRQHCVCLQGPAYFKSRGVFSAAAQLNELSLRADSCLLVETCERLAGVLFLALFQTENESVVAVFLLGALAHDGSVTSDDGAWRHVAIRVDDLCHAHFASNDAGIRVH